MITNFRKIQMLEIQPLVPLLFLTIVILISIFLVSPTEASETGIEVIVSGLEKGDVITLSLMPEPESDTKNVVTIFEKSIEGSGNDKLNINIPINFPDGYYQVLLEDSSKYFRDPKGYFFR